MSQPIPGVDNTNDLGGRSRRFLPIPTAILFILKAAAGRGGRGMRVVYNEKDLAREFLSAKNESKKAFGIDDIFI